MEIYLNRSYKVLYKINETTLTCWSFVNDAKFEIMSSHDIIYCLKEKILVSVLGNHPVKNIMKYTKRKML